MSATQSISNSFFDPETLRILSLALEDAWERIENSRTTLARPVYARAVREVLAHRIIEMAQSGERDVHRLSDNAVVCGCLPSTWDQRSLMGLSKASSVPGKITNCRRVTYRIVNRFESDGAASEIVATRAVELISSKLVFQPIP